MTDTQTNRDLEWHKGKHGWGAHGGYPRHQHSKNGALTIVSDDPRPHFAGGAEFTTPNSKASGRMKLLGSTDSLAHPPYENAYSRAGVLADAADSVDEILSFHRVDLSPAERRELNDAAMTLRRLAKRVDPA